MNDLPEIEFTKFNAPLSNFSHLGHVCTKGGNSETPYILRKVSAIDSKELLKAHKAFNMLVGLKRIFHKFRGLKVFFYFKFELSKIFHVKEVILGGSPPKLCGYNYIITHFFI